MAPSRAAINARSASQFAAPTRRRRTSLGEHAARRSDRVERVGLATRATLPSQPADLEHSLATNAEKACQAGAERAAALDREGPPTCSMLVDEPQGVRVTLAARDDRRLEDDRAAGDVHDRERMRVAVRVDTDDVVQLICKHPRTDLQPTRWGTRTVSVWGWKPRAAEL